MFFLDKKIYEDEERTPLAQKGHKLIKVMFSQRKTLFRS